MKKKGQELFESFSVTEAFAGMRIDRDKGILHGVAMLPGNKITANKNMYGEKALREAQTRYDGAKMFIDHDKEKPVRSVRDFGGVYKNVRIEEGKLRGDLHIRPSMKEQVIELAEMGANGVGLSIRDRGHGETKDGVFIVEGFVGQMFSIDLVSEASSTSNLFEHNNGGNAEEEDTVEKKDITVAFLKKELGDVFEAILNEGKSAVLAELEDSKKKGKTLEESLQAAQKDGVMNAKKLALLEAGFDKPVYESVLAAITPETITVDTAKAIIATNKATIEAVKGTKRSKEPTVIGAGARGGEQDLNEGKVELPSEDDILSALTARR